MKIPISIFITLLSVTGILFARDSANNPKILIAYFTLAQNLNTDPAKLPDGVDTSTHASVKAVDGTYKGDTEIVAEWIQNKTGGKLHAIKTTTTYPNNFEKTVEQNGKEVDKQLRPKLTSTVSDMKEYDTIFIGYPVWYRDLPVAVYSFLERYDLSGKRIIPFALHMGGGLGKSVKTIERLEPEATVLEPLLIFDYRILESEKKLKSGLGKPDLT